MTYERQQVLLTLENVSLKLGENQILENVNAKVHNIHRPGMTQGQVIGFLGPSGRGKTQMSRVLSGLQRPTSGRVLVGEEQKPARVGSMGMVMQHYPLLEHRTIEGNLLLAASLGGLDHEEAMTRIKAYLVRFNLDDKRDFYPAQLSGGQRQRIAIVQQLLSSEHFLIMDEPFSGLDPMMKEEACKLIREIAATDELLTIIVITHDIQAACTISDTLWLLGWPPGQRHGSTLRFEIDLMERGLAWQDFAERTVQFEQTIREVNGRFHEL